MTTLTVLNLANTRVTDSGLAQLKNLSTLESICLDDTSITGAGLTHLREMKQLHHLSLARTNTDDAGIAHLSDLSHSSEHKASVANIPNVGSLRKHPSQGLSIEYLNLTDTHVTDATVGRLREMRSLRYVNVSGTRISTSALDKLKAARPEVMFIP